MSVGREVPPELPVGGTLSLVVGGETVRSGPDPASVEPAVQEVGQITLSGPIHAAEEEDHRESGLAQLHLRHQELLAENRNPFLELLLRYLLAQFGCLEHGSGFLSHGLRSRVTVRAAHDCGQGAREMRSSGRLALRPPVGNI